MKGDELREFIDRYNVAWNAQDLETVMSMHTEDSVFEAHSAGDISTGREAIGRHLAGYYEWFPDLVWEHRRQHLREDLVVQEWTVRGTHGELMHRSGIAVARTGRRVEYRGVDVIVLRDGLIARKDVYSDSVTMLRQLGVFDISPAEDAV